MGNYIVEDDIRDYRFPSVNKPKKNNNLKYITLFVIIAAFIVLIFGVIIISKRYIRDEYTKLEKDMALKAQEYVNSGKISILKETYIDSSKLGVSLPDNCNLLSGVIYKSDEYTPYLLCDDYESNIVTDDSELISLNGSKTVLITKGSNYYDLGYESAYNVQVSGKVDTTKEGVYNIYYISSIGNSFALRKVIVVDNPLANNLVPIINIKDEELELEIGDSYEEKVTAIDKTDGNITDKIVKISNVDLNESGEYHNIYSVTNSLGYTRMSAQKITVLNAGETSIITKLDNDGMSNSIVSIIINIIGDKYDHLILPNGKEITETEAYYPIEENGKYELVAVNKDGTKVSKIVEVNNIDKSIPEGTCSVIVEANRTTFNVSVNSFNYVVSYNYLYNGKESGFIQSSSYTTNEKTTGNLSVKVLDYIGNEGVITCSVSEKKSNLDVHGYQTVISGKPRLHIPISEALAKKGHTINDLNMCIYKRVQEAGPYTRYGVAAAAYGLIDCTYTMTGYVLPYNHTSGKVASDGSINYCKYNSDICGKLGINSKWGSPGGSCAKGQSQCWHGLNCATFVRWAMCNGGMDLCSKGEAGAFGMVNVRYFPEADGVYIKGGVVTHYSGQKALAKYSAEQLVRMIRPGDAMASNEGEGHAFMVVGYNQNGIYTAEDGYYMRYIRYDTIIKSGTNYLILFLDNYYANTNNRNHLYG
jgi:hypothetical protein